MNKPYKKMFSPLVLDLVNNRLVPCNNFEEEFSLIPVFMNGKDNYGFIIIAKKDGKMYCEYYGTEEKIQAAGIEGDYLLIYEQGKFSPWEFKRDGSLVEEAVFNSNFKSDAEYYERHYGEQLPKEKSLI